MEFSIKRDVLLKSLTLAQGIVEKKNTLPILSNVLLNIKKGKLLITATDLDLVFYDEISEVKITTEANFDVQQYWYQEASPSSKAYYLDLAREHKDRDTKASWERVRIVIMRYSRTICITRRCVCYK